MFRWFHPRIPHFIRKFLQKLHLKIPPQVLSGNFSRNYKSEFLQNSIRGWLQELKIRISQGIPSKNFIHSFIESLIHSILQKIHLEISPGTSSKKSFMNSIYELLQNPTRKFHQELHLRIVLGILSALSILQKFHLRIPPKFHLIISPEILSGDSTVITILGISPRALSNSWMTKEFYPSIHPQIPCSSKNAFR